MAASSAPAALAAAAAAPRVFAPLRLRSVVARNRLWVSPMCQYSCDALDGVPHDWHLAHLGQRAAGGAGLVCAEATAVAPEGRISPQDAGIWSEAQTAAWARIAAFVAAQGAVPAIQLAHAGRKASTAAPWLGGAVIPPGDARGGWTPVAPSPLAFDAAPGAALPREMTAADLDATVEAFAAATRNALRAGFRCVELHAAHGYLLHEFLSPLSNAREDENGGSFENRVRFPLRVAKAVRAAWPDELPLFVRLSVSDWAEGGWTADESVLLARRLRDEAGVDLVDCSSGGLTPRQKIAVGPGYQVHFSEQLRREAGEGGGAGGAGGGAGGGGRKLLTAAVGMITTPEQVSACERVCARGRLRAEGHTCLLRPRAARAAACISRRPR